MRQRRRDVALAARSMRQRLRRHVWHIIEGFCRHGKAVARAVQSGTAMFECLGAFTNHGSGHPSVAVLGEVLVLAERDDMPFERRLFPQTHTTYPLDRIGYMSRKFRFYLVARPKDLHALLHNE